MLKFSAFYLEKQKMAFSVLIFSEGFGTIYLDYLSVLHFAGDAGAPFYYCNIYLELGS